MKCLRLLFLLLLGTVITAQGAELIVFAAASLSDALEAIAPLYSQATGNTVRFNFGASGTLARQIKEGAPADVFFSADELRVDQLEKDGLLMPGSRRSLLANTLVLVVAVSDGAAVKSFTNLTDPKIRRVAVGEPATVPVGTYTREYLQTKKLWEPLLNKMVPVDNVRAVLAAVESGNADAGFVYRTDALISKKVRIAFEVPLSDGPKIRYPVAIVKDSKAPEVSRAFVNYLAEPAARAIFLRFGFLQP